MIGEILFGWLVPADFRIRFRPGRGTRVRGRIPKSKIPGIAGFFAHDLAPPGPVTVRGTWGPLGPGRGGLRLWIHGAIVAREQQKVRNFLNDHLR